LSNRRLAVCVTSLCLQGRVPALAGRRNIRHLPFQRVAGRAEAQGEDLLIPAGTANCVWTPFFKALFLRFQLGVVFADQHLDLRRTRLGESSPVKVNFSFTKTLVGEALAEAKRYVDNAVACL
jgi:hypothetical protein